MSMSGADGKRAICDSYYEVHLTEMQIWSDGIRSGNRVGQKLACSYSRDCRLDKVKGTSISETIK